MKIWDAHTGALQRTFTGHTAPVHSVTFSAGDRSLLASAGEDKTIIVWNRATGKAVVAMRGHIDRIGDVKFSRDGSRLASASDDNTIKIWDVATGRELRTLKGHSGEVRRLAFSSDGGLLASASSDQTIKVWDARPIDQLTADQREARALVEFLASKPLMATDVVAEINVWTSIPDRVRQLAAEMAKKLPPSTQASSFENASWDVVVQPFLSPTHYRWAKLQAETAFELNGDGPQLSRTLGAAQYRCGKYEDATATLRRVIEHAARPIDLAFLAMSYRHLANEEGAAESLSRLYEMAETGQWSERECNPRVLAEARSVVEGKAIPIESTWLRKPTNLLDRIQDAEVLVLDEENSGVLSGKCHWKGQKQVIRFVAKKTGKMEARFRPSSTLQVYVWLYAKQDQNKDGLPDRVDGHQPSGKGQEGHVNYDVQAGETYYVEVVSMADPGWGTYELTVGQPPDD